MKQSEIPLVLDGAMGTELIKIELQLTLPEWSAIANETAPNLVRKIHSNYIKAGCDILTTNTFRTTPYIYKKMGLPKHKARSKAKHQIIQAIKLAKQSVSTNQRIAGSITSIEDCYHPNLFPGKNIFLQSTPYVLEWFQEEQVDIILFETIGNLDEIDCIINCIQNCDIPVWLGLILKDETHLLDGNSLKEAVRKIDQSPIELLLLNCNTIPVTLNSIPTLKSLWTKPWGVYPNLGATSPEIDGNMDQIVSDVTWNHFLNSIHKEKPYVIGACCGSSPRHIHQLKIKFHPKFVKSVQ